MFESLPVIHDPLFYAVAVPAVLLVGLSKSGFAAGFGSLATPVLALTVPAQADEEDDGLLTGPEIARLRLGPAWVILSACNTAGDGAAATGLLAQSFFQSGASAVLHSHWPVFDRHAGAIATGALTNFRKAPQEGQAAALRKAMMQSLADRSHPRKAHPAPWAAFSLIGETAPPPTR